MEPTIVTAKSLDDLDEYTRRYCAWTERGIEAYKSTREILMTLFGGAKAGSKTVTGTRIFQTDISNYRDGRFIVIRKNYTVLHKTTLRTFERFFPKELIEHPGADVWKCSNNNQIIWWAADRTRDQNYEKTRGLEASAIMVDEASEFDNDFYELLPSLLRHPAYHLDTGEPLQGYIYLTTNPVPGTNYLKRHFIDPKTRKKTNHRFIPSLPDDNPLLPPGYLDYAFSTMTGAMLEMMRFGNWDIDEGELRIIPWRDLEQILTRRVYDRTAIAAGIDIGLGRPDPTKVYCGNRSGEIWCEDQFEEYDTMKQVARLLPICRRVQDAGGYIYIDRSGVGKGVADALAGELDWGRLVPVDFGESAVDEPLEQIQGRYENRRVQLYWWTRKDFEAAAMQVRSGVEPIRMIEKNDLLIEDFENVFFIPLDGNIRLESKKVVKQRLGRSTDDGDAAVLCNGALREFQVLNVSLPSRRRIEDSGDRRRSRRLGSSITQGYD